jgi:hypothetical protein
MVNNNKILTVSYGTFSCTLEGFDDSFGTMKAIAEYFRDLASDDRYFGAEPPQLDAEMLARIAQRQISSPVAAYQGESGIVLRASEADTVNAATTPDTEVAKVDETPVTEPEPATAETVVAETVAVEEIEVTEAPVPDAPIEVAAVKAAIAEQVEAEQKEIAPEVTDTPEAAIKVEPEVAAPEAAPMQAYVEPDVVEEDDIAPAPDSIAAKLQRIRAVVSRNEATNKIAGSAGNANPDGFLSPPATLQNEEFEDEDLIGTENSAESFAADESIDLSDPIAQDRAEDDFQDEDALETVAENEDHAVKDFAAPDSIETTATTDDTETPDTSVVLAETEDDDLFGDDNDDDGDDDDLANLLADVREPQKTAQPLGNARVLKIKRTDFEAAVVSGQIEPISEDTKSSESTLSDEDEAELLRELAQVEADDAVDTDSDPVADDQSAISQTDAEFESEDPLESDFAYEDDDTQAESSHPTSAEDDEDDLSRLMDAADSKMEEPETASRREAYSHLRAAVTVANAEHAAGGSVDSHTDDGAYREDLASVVRPRRPHAIADAAQSKRSNRPVAGKSAPLKLVAEQRVDDQAEHAPRGPVRPRRVSAVQVEETHVVSDDTKGNFVGFAQEMEPTDLKELLEAAAAYMSFVEGREYFSRPQLMTKVRQVETSNFNREDGLRSFGKLLREGKIRKTSGGRFTASETIGFRPDERAAG